MRGSPPTSSSWSAACRKSPAGSGSGVPHLRIPPSTHAQTPRQPTWWRYPYRLTPVPPASESFLGNNGFYTGVPGDPGALQLHRRDRITLYFTNIKVLDQNGNSATHWQLVTGDAESTDPHESITWSSCPATTGGGLRITCTGTKPATQHLLLSLIPNNPTSTPIDEYGNACINTKYTTEVVEPTAVSPSVAGQCLGITAAAQEVECAADVTEDKTGTVMLQAPEPTNLTVNMVGTGLQAIFLGFLL